MVEEDHWRRQATETERGVTGRMIAIDNPLWFGDLYKIGKRIYSTLVAHAQSRRGSGSSSGSSSSRKTTSPTVPEKSRSCGVVSQWANKILSHLLSRPPAKPFF